MGAHYLRYYCLFDLVTDQTFDLQLLSGNTFPSMHNWHFLSVEHLCMFWFLFSGTRRHAINAFRPDGDTGWVQISLARTDSVVPSLVWMTSSSLRGKPEVFRDRRLRAPCTIPRKIILLKARETASGVIQVSVEGR